MQSFQHIRLQTHKGLKGAILNDLQKINVVCGPNNSGKTTVLECAANPKLSLMGLTISGDAAKSTAKEGASGFGWGSDTLIWIIFLCSLFSMLYLASPFRLAMRQKNSLQKSTGANILETGQTRGTPATYHSVKVLKLT